MKKTGDTCDTAGTYETSCADKVQQNFEQNAVFPVCPTCRENVNWSPVVPQ